jgi:predicted transcriptional regulator
MMEAITISLYNEDLAKLREMADRHGISPEELARVSIEELLARPEEEFQRAVDYVLGKNEELYRRLA